VERWTKVAGIAAAQHGVITLQQLRASGWTESMIRRALERGQLHRIAPRTFAIAGAPATWRMSLQAALLALGACSVVAGRSAACLLGFDSFEEGPVEVLVPRRERMHEAIAVVRSTSHLPALDVIVEPGGFRCTSAARTIIDLAGLVSPRRLEDAIDSAVRAGQTSLPFLHRRLAALRHRGRPGVARLDALLGDSGGTTRLERLFLQLVRRAGLPRPRCQMTHRSDGRFVARTDFTWEAPRVIAEVEGQGRHASPRERQHDAQRRNELQQIGWFVLTFTYEDVTGRPAWVAAQVDQALTARAPPEAVPRFESGNPLTLSRFLDSLPGRW
jgi:very-short-patch-repair endonuclease